MNTNEVLKLALEALESCGAAHITDGGRQWYDEKLVDTAYAALQEALADQPAQQRTEELLEIFKDVDQCGPLLGMGQPAQQEPVAWRVKVETTFRDGSVNIGYQVRNEKMSRHDEPLYTPPPAQRTWVGLTDEELRQVWYDDAPVEGGTYIDKLRQVEAKLKEKNT